MEGERARKIEELYHAALERDAEERARLLAAAEPEVRREVESLLAYDSGASLPPAFVAGAPGDTPMPAAIGHYRILSRIGEGGMGVVYKAEQDRPRRVVALKVIRPGWCTAEMQRRFERESQALGRLRHPGIAQIYEAGTADTGSGAQPYFVMEFIHGSPLGQYVAAHRLSTNQRLELMARICDAVHHAHQKGIIHRDLKPGNVLVDENGQPKVLDFGVARITDGEDQATRKTEFGQIVGTLAYMSPEQVMGDPLELDTRSDVYSLGVILYELLCGRLPYQVGKQLAEAVRTIRESDPQPLSAIDRVYRGDIETIVTKALDKEKARRYTSAADLGQDIRRYLRDEPVAARPPSSAYQLRKFARRHRALVAGVSAVLVVLVAGIVASTLQAIRANRAMEAAVAARNRATAAESEARKERDRAREAEQAATRERNKAVAEKRRADTAAETAQAVRDYLQQDLLAQATILGQSKAGVKPDPDLKVRTALDRAAAGIPGKFEGRPLVEASIRQTIAAAYKELGLFPDALRHAERAVEIQRREHPGDHPDKLAAMLELAQIHHRRGDFAASLALHTQVLEALRRTLGENHVQTLETMDGVAAALQSLGRYAESITMYKRALAGSRRVRGEGHPDTGELMGGLALNYTRLTKYSEAEALNVKGLEILRKTLGEEHPRTLVSKNNLAQVYLRQSKLSEAAELQLQALDAQRRLLGEEHDQTLTSMGNLGVLYARMGKLAEAEEQVTKVASLMRRVLGENHSSTLTAMNNVANVYSRRGRLEEAERLYREVLERRQVVLGPDHVLTASTMHSLAMVLRQQSRYADAEALLTKAVDVQRRLLGMQSPDTQEDVVLLAESRILQRKYIVEGSVREAIQVMEQQKAESWTLSYARSLLGASLAWQKQYAAAEPLLLAGYEWLNGRKASLHAVGRSALDRSGAWIVQLYRDWEKPELSAQWQARIGPPPATGEK